MTCIKMVRLACVEMVNISIRKSYNNIWFMYNWTWQMLFFLFYDIIEHFPEITSPGVVWRHCI